MPTESEPVTVTPEDRKAVRAGSMTVTAAVEFSGIGRTQLFALMRSGALPWFWHGKHCRLIERAALEELLARMRAASRAARGATRKNRVAGGTRSRA